MQLDVALDAIEHAALRVALRAVDRMDLRVPQPYRHRFEWPLLAACIERHGHGRARAKRTGEKVVGTRTCVSPSERGGFVYHQTVASHGDFLCKSLCTPVDHYFPELRCEWWLHRLVAHHSPPSFQPRS